MASTKPVTGTADWQPPVTAGASRGPAGSALLQRGEQRGDLHVTAYGVLCAFVE